MTSGRDIQVVQGLELAKAGKHAEAIAHLRRFIQRFPANLDAHNVLGQVFAVTGQEPQALFHFERAVQGQPNSPIYLNNLASVLARVGQPRKAIDLFQRAVRAQPDYLPAWVGMGMAASIARDYDLSVQAGQMAVQYGSHIPEAHQNFALALLESGRVDEAIAALEHGLRCVPHAPLMRSTLLIALNYTSSRSREEVLAKHREYGSMISGSVAAWPRGDDPDRPLRVGFLSADFKTHSVMYFAEPLLEHRDRGAFHATLYAALIGAGDATTNRVRALGDCWVEAMRLGDADLDARIRADKIDILVDLGGHTAGNRLAALARKPAPIIVHAIGYPHTTGMASVDARIVDSITDPPGAESWARERLVRIDPCFLCYRPRSDAPEPRLAAHEGVVFGSFNALPKVSERTVALWAEVLKANPGSRLVLKSGALADPNIQTRQAARFAAHGIDRSRLTMLGVLDSPVEHLALYSTIDVALDTTPYGGTTTTCEALWMGTPVVTFRGEAHASRVGASLLSAVGLPDLIASSTEDFVRIASDLARDVPRRQRLRTDLRGMVSRSPLRDEAGYTRRFFAALRGLWQDHCRAGSAG